MTLFKKNKFSTRSKSNSSCAPVTTAGYPALSQENNELHQPNKSKEAIHCEQIGLIEDSFVQEIVREKGMTHI